MPDRSFRYRLEAKPPRTGPGGITRGASVREFPASVGIAGVSMRLAPGAMRELHWHANAAEWAFVISLRGGRISGARTPRIPASYQNVDSSGIAPRPA